MPTKISIEEKRNSSAIFIKERIHKPMPPQLIDLHLCPLLGEGQGCSIAMFPLFSPTEAGERKREAEAAISDEEFQSSNAEKVAQKNDEEQ